MLSICTGYVQLAPQDQLRRIKADLIQPLWLKLPLDESH